MVEPRFQAGADVPRRGSDGRVFIPTPSGERQYLETAATTAAVHGNPGFEDETAGVPDVWEFVYSLGTTDVDTETTVVYSGERSLRVHIAAGGGHQVVMSDAFDVAGRGSVEFAGFACKTEGSPTITRGILTGASGTPVFLDPANYENNEDAPTAVATSWEQYGRAAEVPGRHARARLFFRIAPTASEACTVYLDLTTSAVFAAAAADTDWLELDFGTGWEPWSSTSVELPRARRQGDRVTLCGNVQRTSGSGTLVCTLPLELRPPRALNRGGQVVNGAGTGAVIVAANGEVSLTSAYTNGQFVSLDVEFPVDQD